MLQGNNFLESLHYFMKEKKTNLNKRKKILIIDEDKKLTAIYQKKIENFDYQVVVYHQINDWSKKIKKEIPDLILMNLFFFKESGWEILKNIKKLKAFTNIPVIVFSQLSQKEDIKKALTLGVKYYFIKNHNSLNDILKKIKLLIEK